MAAWDPIKTWGNLHDFESRTKWRMARSVSPDWTASVRLERMKHHGDESLQCTLTAEYLPLADWINAHLDRRSDGQVWVTPALSLAGHRNSALYRVVLNDEQARSFGQQVVGVLDDHAAEWIAEHSNAKRIVEEGNQVSDLVRAIVSGLLGNPERAAKELQPRLDGLARMSESDASHLGKDVLAVVEGFELGLEVPTGSSSPQRGIASIPVNTSPAGIQIDLYHYGEDELAERARHLTTAELDKISLGAGRLLFDDPNTVNGLLSKAIAEAAVEVLEGRRRPLRRKRRRRLDSRPPWLTSNS